VSASYSSFASVAVISSSGDALVEYHLRFDVKSALNYMTSRIMIENNKTTLAKSQCQQVYNYNLKISHMYNQQLEHIPLPLSYLLELVWLHSD
jgi:hypothetical protein